MFQAFQLATDSNDRSYNILMLGPSGTGKSTVMNTVRYFVRDELVYNINTMSNFLLDGICAQHKVIFIDNVELLIRDNCNGLSLLIQLLDRGGRFTIDIKHKQKVLFNPGRFVILAALNVNGFCEK